MEKYVYRPVRFYLITFAATWFWWLFAILVNEGISLYLGMFLGLISIYCIIKIPKIASQNGESCISILEKVA